MRGDILLGTTSSGRKIWLPRDDRKLHTHILGAPRRGKSRMMEHMIRSDIENGDGLLLLDPHGELYDRVVAWCAAENLFKQRERRRADHWAHDRSGADGCHGAIADLEVGRLEHPGDPGGVRRPGLQNPGQPVERHRRRAEQAPEGPGRAALNV